LNIMEGLVRRDRHLRLQPGLATLWEVLTPLHWQFHLRRGVTQREHRAGEVMRFARNETLGGRA
jgi:MarR-like DNA-binding transcriptional regulator SgrR of sgrS sRNA